MASDFQKALIAGVERVSAWSDVLDQINVFPVADGDTGRNLKISLTPLRSMKGIRENTIRDLQLSARGNSGNIATSFFSGFLKTDSCKGLCDAARTGRDLAWQAVHDPVPGTMLTIFDELVDFLERNGFEETPQHVSEVVDHLEKAVRSTPELLPKLKQAGVVDAGALGMYIFFEGFFSSLVGRDDEFRLIPDAFENMLQVSPAFQEETEEGYCVDMVLHLQADAGEKVEKLSEYGGSLVVIPHQEYYKVHLHTADAGEARARIEGLGRVVQWSDDDLGSQIKAFKRCRAEEAIHIMTDAAGSVTRADCSELGITLLESYITAGEKSLPETLFHPAELYRLMRSGVRASTSQASVFERHQYYQRILHQYSRALYLCTGTVFTGNYQVAMDWKQKHDPENRLTVIDTTAASGRLGLLAIATARYSAGTADPKAVIEFAEQAVHQCREYVFLDKLKYLAAGGRLSRPSAFLGDALHMKPIISPTAEGAKKMGVVKNQEGQLEFAFQRLEEFLDRGSAPLIMLEYTDNRDWVSGTSKKEIERLYPSAEVLLQPLSLTSGVHMGPGTWAVAFLPEPALGLRHD
ncbi:MAG: DegV family protein [Desulfobacterales bacterium]|nr:DegV family protein [Desulfobacterales bacterium]